MSRGRALAVVVASVAVLGLTWLHSAGAATLVDDGWWDRNQGLTIGAAAPPPEGALRVANDPQGPSAVAAVRYRLDAEESLPVLRLRVIGEAAGDNAGFEACATDGTWAAADGGSFDDRPADACDRGRVAGTVSDDGTTVTFLVAPIANADAVDVVILPAPTAGDPVGDTFSVDFAAPTDEDLLTTVTPSSSPPSTATASPTTAQAGSAPPAPVATTAAPAPPPTVAAPTATTTFSPATIAAPAPTTVPSPTPTVLEQTAPASSEDGGRNRIGALAVAAALVGIGIWWWRTEQQTAVDGPVVAGLGRFRRERTAAAPEVS